MSDQKSAVVTPNFHSTARMLICFAYGAIKLDNMKSAPKAMRAVLENIRENISPDVARAIILDAHAAQAASKMPPSQSFDKMRDSIVKIIQSFSEEILNTDGTKFLSDADKIANESAPIVDTIAALKKQYADIKKEKQQITSLEAAIDNPSSNTNHAAVAKLKEELAKLKQQQEIHVNDFMKACEKCSLNYKTVMNKFEVLYELAAKRAPAAAAKLSLEGPREEQQDRLKPE